MHGFIRRLSMLALPIALLWGVEAARSQTVDDPCRDPERYVDECAAVDIGRPRPSFSESSLQGFERRGFRGSFLEDALNGIADPLGGGTIGGGEFVGGEFAPVSPGDRGLLPSFDPTDVIIPLPGVRK